MKSSDIIIICNIACKISSKGSGKILIGEKCRYVAFYFISVQGENKVKKFLSVFLMVVLILSLFACNKTESEEDGTQAFDNGENAVVEEIPAFDKEEAEKEVMLLADEFMGEFVRYMYHEDNRAEIDSFMASSYSIDYASVFKANTMLNNQFLIAFGDWTKNLLSVAGEEASQEWIDETVQDYVFKPLLDAAMNKSDYSISSVSASETYVDVNISANLAESFDISTTGMQIDPLLISNPKQMVRNAFLGLNYDSMVIMGQANSVNIRFIMEDGEWKINQVLL